MKNIVHFLVVTLLMVRNQAIAQSFCASIVKNIGFEKRAGSIEYVTKLNATTALFYAEDQYYGHELWKTDGTSQGTTMVKDIAVGTSSSRNKYPSGSDYTLATINKPVVVGNVMYFEANDNIHGFEIWRTDGTHDGTFLLKDINTDEIGYSNEQKRYFTIFNDEIYFWDNSKKWSESNSTNKLFGNLFRLFKTKGTPETTVLVGEFKSNSFSTPPPLALFKESVAFVVERPIINSSSTKSIFYQVDKSGSISENQLHSNGITNIGIADGQIYFNNSKGLYKSDGTTNGTVLIRENGSVFNAILIGNSFWSDGKFIYFLIGANLWRTDGTTPGTFAIRNNLTFDSYDLSKQLIFVYKNELYFVDSGTEDNRSYAIRLWKTDGTARGTIPIVDIDPENKSYRRAIRLITEINGYLYFYGKIEGVTSDIDARSGIYKSDGTSTGTTLLCPLGPNLGCQLINPTFEDYGFVAIENSLLFLGTPLGFVENYGDVELYRTNLTNCPNITATITGTAAFCPNTSTTLSTTAAGGTGPYTYRWQQGTTGVGTGVATLAANAAGTYTVTVADANGCAGTAQVTVSQRTVPTVTVSPTAAFCAGQSTSLTAVASGGTEPYAYQWKQGTTNAGSTITTLTVSTGGVYSVAATDANGCTSTTAAATVTQRPIPTATATASAPGFTTGGNVTLTAATNTGQTFQWTLAGQPIAGANTRIFIAQQPGTYAVNITNSDGCSATSLPVTISLITAIEEPQPDPDFQIAVTPNPGQVVAVRLTNQRGKVVLVTLTVRDLAGRSLYQKQVKLTGQHTEPFDLTQQPVGLYLLQASTSTQQRTLRLIRE